MSKDSKRWLRGMRAVNGMGISICFGALALSFNLVALTEVANLMKLKNHLTQEQLVFQLSIATSCFNLGNIMSPFLYLRWIKYFGQRKGLIYIDSLAIIITIAQLFVLRFQALAASRFFLGILLGMSVAITPVFLNSIAPPQVSGKLGTYNQVFQTIGVLFAYTLGTMITLDENDQIRWRLFIGFPIIFFILRILSLQFVFPFDTVQRHMALNQTEKLKQFCLQMYESDSQQTVQTLISSKIREEKQQTYSSTLKKRLIIAIVVIASNQITGINGILYYAKQLFSKVTQGKEQYSQILIIQLSLLQVVSTLLSTEIVDRIGRKKILLTGQSTIGVILLSIFLFDRIGGKVGEFGVLILLFLHILVMNMTLGSVCIVYCTQILNDISWVIFTLKSCALLVALTTDYMIEYWGLGLMLLLYFALTLLSFLFLRTRLHETAGISRDEVYRRFESEKHQTPESAGLIENQE